MSEYLLETSQFKGDSGVELPKPKMSKLRLILQHDCMRQQSYIPDYWVCLLVTSWALGL